MYLKGSLTNKYFVIVSIFGWILIFIQLVSLHRIHHLYIYIILISFLYLIEQFPIPVGRGSTSFSFPIIYTIYLLYQLPLMLLSLSSVVLLTLYFRHQSLKILLFKPAQIAISLYLAINGTDWLLSMSHIQMFLLKPLCVILLYYVFYTMIVDLFILAQATSHVFKKWRHKLIIETAIALLSVLYIWFMDILGNQDRGTIDVLSYFFFFSPLTGMSLVISIIVRLQKEKNKLKSLFSITNNLNKGLTAKNWLTSIVKELKLFLNFDASLLVVVESNTWRIMHTFGFVHDSLKLTDEMIEELKKVRRTTFVNNRIFKKSPVEDMFQTNIHSLAYSPLFVENELVGVWIIGRLRKNQFRPEDVYFIEILANQLSIVKKSRHLIAEQATHKIIEERNRIAREIHDGIAQSLAGVILSLETAQRKYDTRPNESYRLVEKNINKLRISLKEVRESIYSLKPNPIKYKGLIPAIESLIENCDDTQSHVTVHFDIRGTPTYLSLMVEKILFEVVQEGLRNVYKHAKAQSVDILLSYNQKNILLKIKDDGVGFSLVEAMVKAKNEPHFGILNINDLAERLGASLQIDSKPGKGTELIFQIPNLEIEEGDNDD